MKIEERLTFRNQVGLVCKRGYEIMLQRLAAYEDTELSPTEVKAIKEKLTPKAPKPNKRIPGIGKCLICKTELCIDDDDLCYCPRCGQRLK